MKGVQLCKAKPSAEAPAVTGLQAAPDRSSRLLITREHCERTWDSSRSTVFVWLRLQSSRKPPDFRAASSSSSEGSVSRGAIRRPGLASEELWGVGGEPGSAARRLPLRVTDPMATPSSGKRTLGARTGVGLSIGLGLLI